MNATDRESSIFHPGYTPPAIEAQEVNHRRGTENWVDRAQRVSGLTIATAAGLALLLGFAAGVGTSSVVHTKTVESCRAAVQTNQHVINLLDDSLGQVDASLTADRQKNVTAYTRAVIRLEDIAVERNELRPTQQKETENCLGR